MQGKLLCSVDPRGLVANLRDFHQRILSIVEICWLCIYTILCACNVVRRNKEFSPKFKMSLQILNGKYALNTQDCARITTNAIKLLTYNLKFVFFHLIYLDCSKMFKFLYVIIYLFSFLIYTYILIKSRLLTIRGTCSIEFKMHIELFLNENHCLIFFPRPNNQDLGIFFFFRRVLTNK